MAGLSGRFDRRHGDPRLAAILAFVQAAAVRARIEEPGVHRTLGQ